MTRSVVLLAAFLLGGSLSAFAQLPPHYPTVTVSTAGSGTGTVWIRRSVDFPRFVELTAYPSAGSVFAGWSSNCMSAGSLCFLMVFPPLRGLEVTATFNVGLVPTRPTRYRLSVAKAGNGTGTVLSDIGPITCGGMCSAFYDEGTVVTLTSAAGSGQIFSGWSGGGCSGTSTCSVTMTTATTVTATFTNPVTPSSTPAEATVDLNQHGLTGLWYEPATSGQGFAVQVIPEQSPGLGLAFVSWFTFDTVIGGAERQRWYTLHGPVETGKAGASLTIYQNTGGNFNAPPATEPHAVGTATLSFTTSSSGSLSYTFTDGSGRAGTIPLTRLLPNATCADATPYPTQADFALSGSWYAGPATSGQGFTVEVSPSSGAFFLTWSTYMPNGANAGAAGQRWYTAQGTFTPGLRTIPVQIYATTGGVFDAFQAGQETVQVGTGTMTFQDCSAATFSYDFTGGTNSALSGTIDLRRVGPVPPGCGE